MTYHSISDNPEWTEAANKRLSERSRKNTGWDCISDAEEMWELSGKDIHGNDVTELCLSKARSKTEWAEFPEMKLVRS